MADNTRIEELRRRLEREPGSRLFAQLAEEFRKEGEHEEAIRVARNGLASQPNYPSARMTLGRALLDSGDFTSARVEFETVLRGAPDNILASRFLAECLEGVGDLGSALLQYRAAQRLVPGDKNLEAHIRALEQTLSAPTMVRRTVDGESSMSTTLTAEPPAPPPPVPAPPVVTPHVPPLPPPPPALLAPPPLPPPPAPSRVVAAPAPILPAAPPPVLKTTATAEFERQSPSRAAVAEPPRPPVPPPLPPPAPEPPSPPTLVEESFDLEAPFNVPTPLRADDFALPGRTLHDEAEEEAPTLPVTKAPNFDFEPPPPSSPGDEPMLVPEAPPRPAPPPPAVVSEPTLPPLPPGPPPPVAVPPPVAARPSLAPPPPVTASVPAVPDPLDNSRRAPAPPRAKGLEETQEIGSTSAGASPAREVDTTRVPVVTFPIAPPPPPPAPPRAPLDSIRLEWAPAPDAQPSTAPPEPPLPAATAEPVLPRASAPAPIPGPVAEAPPPVVAPPIPEPPRPLPPPVATPAPSEPLLSSTLAELYFSQGAVDMARTTYEQLLQREPTNERYLARLEEIRRGTAAAPADDRAERRRAIEGQIARLEQLLAVVKRARA